MAWGFLVGLIEPVTDYFKQGQAIKAAKKERGDELKKMALETKLTGIKNSDQATLDLDVGSRKFAGAMDDVSFYLFLLPVPLVFYPPMQIHVMSGFKALESMPVWYQATLGLMLASVWGYRKLVQPIILKFLGKKP